MSSFEAAVWEEDKLGQREKKKKKKEKETKERINKERE